jgi:peptidyl-prolyl cis-trans isomerase C
MSLRRAASLVLVTLALAGCAGLNRPEIARVGERDVSAADLRRAVALQRVLADLQGTPCGGPPQAGESATTVCQRAALSSELLWLGVRSYAEEHDLVAEAADAENAVAGLEAQVGEEELADALTARGVTRDDLLELGRRILTVNAVRLAVTEERVGIDELRAQYDQRSLDFTNVEADHIVVESRAEAEQVYRRVQGATREEFDAVARETSTEPGADASGGQLGSAAASGYVPAFAEAVVALEPGEISQPVHTQFGWHVIYLVDKVVTPFEEAKATLAGPHADREFPAWLAEQADELGVEVDPRFGRFRPDRFSVEPARSTDPDAVEPSASP